MKHHPLMVLYVLKIKKFSSRSHKEVGFLFNYGKTGAKIVDFCLLLLDQAQVGDGRHHL